MTKTRRRRGGQIYTQQPITIISDISNIASKYGEKTKEGLISGYNNVTNWFSNLGKPATPSLFGGKKRSIHKHNISCKHRGGNNVKSYNTYVDRATMNASQISGYSTAMPHKWVGGKTIRKWDKKSGATKKRRSYFKFM